MNETDMTKADGIEHGHQGGTTAGGGAENDTPRKGAQRAKKAHIESIAQLIRTNYETKTGVKELQEAEVRAVLSAPEIDETTRAELLELAREDKTLQQTKQLMLLSARSERPKIVNGLREFVRRVLATHPLFQDKLIAGVLANPHDISVDSAIAMLVATDAKVQGGKGEKALTPNQVVQRRTNAVHCLVLLLRTMQGISLLQIQRCLQKHLWVPKARRYRTEEEMLQVLVTSRDPVAASVTFTLLDDEAMKQELKTDAAALGELRAKMRVQELEQQVADLEGDLRKTKGEREVLRQWLDEATQTHAIKEARWRDDYETLKGRTLHRLIEESSLLEEGLHALKRERPRVPVMIDHAERVIQGLKHEADRIRKDVLG